MAEEFYTDLINGEKLIGDRYFCVFQLKNIESNEAIEFLKEAYAYCGSSVLLKHELLYALGQLPS